MYFSRIFFGLIVTITSLIPNRVGPSYSNRYGGYIHPNIPMQSSLISYRNQVVVSGLPHDLDTIDHTVKVVGFVVYYYYSTAQLIFSFYKISDLFDWTYSEVKLKSSEILSPIVAGSITGILGLLVTGIYLYQLNFAVEYL
jgi:hypothetical protein